MDPLIALEELETFAQGLDHAEGICLAPDGHLYVGGEAGQLYRVVGEQVEEVMTTEGFLLGLAADAESNIYACDQEAACVWKLIPDSRERIVFSNGTPDRPMRTPNWGCFDAKGNYYVSDSGGWQQADGSSGAREVLTDLPGSVPDGVAITADGAFVISCYRPDVVYLWDPEQGLRVLAEDPQGTIIAAPTNVVFTGDELEVMVVPNLGRWHLTRIRAEIPGTPLFYPTGDQLAK